MILYPRCSVPAAPRLAGTVLVACSALTAATQPTLAIPSPELVVGSLSSLSQLTALLSAIFGGGALAFGSRLSNARKGSGETRRTDRIALACLAAALCGFGLAYYQHHTSTSLERSRLEQTLLRPTPKAAEGRTLDPLLKEIPYSKQVSHSRALSTDQAENIVAGVAAGTAPDWMILDIRETAETEMGSLPGAVKIRFPDLDRSRIDFTNRKSLLICHNGNRSAETCEAIAAKGIDCRFIAGGLEKWLAEGRTLGGSKVRSVDDLRALPPYPNQATLLDTAQVHELVDNNGAIFVDVRYSGEFAGGHLPGAINIPIRPTPTNELAELVDALPHKPVIAPCYDRRSCFFGEVLGLTLARAGRDFRGRYSVPWEYFVPSKRPPHVEALLAQQNKTSWARAGEALAAALLTVAETTGLPAALLLMALLSRMLILPFSLKAERDQLAADAIKAEISDIKARLADDPRRLARALRAIYRRAALTPGRNLVALLFLPILALAVGAAIEVARAKPSALLWIPDLSLYDPWQAMPALFAVLIGIYLQAAFVTTRRQAAIAWFLAAPLLFAAAAILPAAAGLYMTASAALLLAQRFLISGLPGWKNLKMRMQMTRNRVAMARLGASGIVPLSDVDALTGAGNKAKRLSQLKSLGLPVPAGLVLTPDFLRAMRMASADWRAARIDAIWRHFGGHPLAVRSSGALEDGGEMSFAGVFESVLHCERANLEDAILRVSASFNAASASAYKAGAAGQTGHILIQPMVAARFAGVLFTQDMQEPGQMLVELVEGTADKLVSGRATPQMFRIGRISGDISGPAAAPIDLAPLASLARRVEAHLGCPQDIEWAFDGVSFILLQARDVTATLQEAAERAERNRLLAHIAKHDPKPAAGTIIFQQGDVAELLPRPTSASLSLLNDMWHSGGSVDLALRSLGFEAGFSEDGPPLHATIFGRLYTDCIAQAARAPRISRLAVRRLEKALPDIERSFREEFLPSYLSEARLLQATDFTRLRTGDLHQAFTHIRRRFIEETHAEVSRVNIAAQFALDLARESLAAEGRDPAIYLAGTGATELELCLPAAMIEAEGGSCDALRDLIGHRASLDYELAVPRHGETPDFAAAGRRLAGALTSPRKMVQPNGSPQGLSPSAAKKVATALSLQTLKEDAKHHGLRELAALRAVLAALDQRYALDGEIFHLTLDEIAALDTPRLAELLNLARQRATAYRSFAGRAPLPATLTLAWLEGAQQPATGPAAEPLHGQRVSGAGDVIGRACVVSAKDADDGRAILELGDGEIIVAPFLHPAWLPELMRASGAAVSIGGWLSHMAIVAREHGKAMIVGAHLLDTIETGSLIKLCANGRIEILEAPAAAYATAAE